MSASVLRPELLEALGSDDWARLLPVLRTALHDIEEPHAGPTIRRLRASPTGRLASGRPRRELCTVVCADPRLRAAVDERLAAAQLPAALRARLGALDGDPSGEDESPAAPPAGTPAGARDDAGTPDGPGTAQAPAAPGAEIRRLDRAARDAARRADRASRRLREVRAQRDELARRVEGAQARADGAQREAARLRTRNEELSQRAESLAEQLEDAARERRTATEREGRRADRALAELREEVRGLRRREQEQRAELDRLRRERRTATAGDGPPRAVAAPSDPPPTAPGRPTRLPETVARGTTEEVDHLLSRGRLVAVDGYNVTRGHQPQLDLASQRDWLVRRLASLAAQRGVRPVVVFDGEHASGSRPAVGAREVQVRFTPSGITADDELVFLVAALPDGEPALVVTDDRELRTRLLEHHVDVVATGPFLWATPG